MKPNTDKLAFLYINARRVVAEDEADSHAVSIAALFGAKRDIRTIEEIFPTLRALSFSLDKRTGEWHIRYGDDLWREQVYHNRDAAVEYGRALVLDLFKENNCET